LPPGRAVPLETSPHTVKRWGAPQDSDSGKTLSAIKTTSGGPKRWQTAKLPRRQEVVLAAKGGPVAPFCRWNTAPEEPRKSPPRMAGPTTNPVARLENPIPGTIAAAQAKPRNAERSAKPLPGPTARAHEDRQGRGQTVMGAGVFLSQAVLRCLHLLPLRKPEGVCRGHPGRISTARRVRRGPAAFDNA